MRKHSRVPLFAAAISIAIIFCFHAHSAEQQSLSHTLNPVAKPLSVARVKDVAILKKLLSTRQARAFGLDTKDFSGEIPGVGAEVDSAKTFLDALVQAEAENLWYGLAQRGGSILDHAGAMGWDWSVESGDEDAAARLGRMGLDVGGLDVDAQPIGSGRERIVVSRDAETRKGFFGGNGESKSGIENNPRDADWRDTLSAFLSGGEGSAGVWVNARPLFGFLSILSGIDLRSKLNAVKMRVPEWTRVEFRDDGGDSGLEIRMNNILPEGIRNSEAHPLLIHNKNSALVTLNVHVMEDVWNVLGYGKTASALANTDIDALLPRSVGITFRRNDSDQVTSDTILLVPDSERLDESLGRLHEAYAELAETHPALAGIEETRSRWGNVLFTIRFGKASRAAGRAAIDTAGGKSIAFVFSRTAEDWPNPEDWTLIPGETSCIAEWRSRPDPASRASVIRFLAAFLRENGMDMFTEQLLDEFLPDTHNGHIALENNELVIRAAK